MSTGRKESLILTCVFQVKPFCQWEKLDMSSLERRKLLCSVSFHLVAIICVVWSLYILIDRTAAEIRTGVLAWPFWTKLVVVGIGFTGGLVFMYVQCKVYVHLCRKWKAYNRIIVVQDAPEGVHKATESKTSQRSSVDHNSLSLDSQREVSNVGGGNLATTAGTPSSETAATAAAIDPGDQLRKSNAETQTALRGVSLMKVLQEEGAPVSGSESGVKVVQILADGMKTEEAGTNTETIFFTECECSTNGKSVNLDSDLPGSCHNEGATKRTI